MNRGNADKSFSECNRGSYSARMSTKPLAPPPAQAALDPAFAAVGAQLAAHGLRAPPLLTTPIGEVRQAQDRIGAFMAEGSVALADERMLDIALADGRRVRAALVRPATAQAVPVLIYLHGGGFSHGKLATWAPLARETVRGSGVAVLLLDYPLAPEHPYPQALDAVVGVARALAAHGSAWGLDPGRVALGGDSAGANLALAAAMQLRDQGWDALRFLLLFYGVYSSDLDSPSWQALGQGQYGLSVATMKKIWQGYTGQDVPAGDWRVTPLDGDMAGLPPAWACVGTLDPLLDDSLRLQRRLQQAGVPCALRICEGLPHAFVRHVRRVPSVDAALAEGVAALREALA